MRAAALLGVVALAVGVTAGCERTYGPLPDTDTTAYVPEDEAYLLRNAIYSAGPVPAVPCTLPKLALRSQQTVRRYATAVLVCLQRAWKPLVERSGVGYFPPVVYAVNDGAKTRCGIFDKEFEGLYCDANWGIYLDWDELVEEDPDDRMPAAVHLQVTMAHEFGHHVQQLVGIARYFDERWEQTTGAEQLEQGRRNELQASCFASAFLGANQKTLGLYGDKLAEYRWVAYAGDDDPPVSTPDHGSRKSNTAWANAAFKAKSPAACNTWAASAKRVS
ncbi:neutral zinc metallopeptidase [Kribbella speibonae]|uniref:Metalloprotease n=1 Tax=Kribbella speibonae TaxID=1572660 RepID=A0A4R0IV39_9ACTN|nr:neutral zinc metallopeptidase [Kribbella speibonae]TCC35348.1 hypothetical protein E0H92_21565 [Kribbella speibonae]